MKVGKYDVTFHLVNRGNKLRNGKKYDTICLIQNRKEVVAEGIALLNPVDIPVFSKDYGQVLSFSRAIQNLAPDNRKKRLKLWDEFKKKRVWAKFLLDCPFPKEPEVA